MTNIFLKLLNMSMTAGWLILAVMVLRMLLRKAPKWIRCFLWMLVAVRLACPISLESAFSMVPSSETFLLGTSAANTIMDSDEPTHFNNISDKTATASGHFNNTPGKADASLGNFHTVPDRIDAGLGHFHSAPGRADFALGSVSYITVNSGVPLLDNFVNSILAESFSPQKDGHNVPLWGWATVCSIIWVVGVAAMLVYATVSYLRLYSRIRTAIRFQGNIFLSEYVDTPFIFGIIHPRIYLPSGMSQEMCIPVIAHEQAHLKRLDYLWKVIGYGLLSVYWFHPLCWVSYALFCKDIELACDEKVIQNYSSHEKKLYSEALLACSLNKRTIAVCPLAFGEVSVKERIKSVLNYKKPAFRAVCGAIILCVIAALCFMTNPAQNHPSQTLQDGIADNHDSKIQTVNINDSKDQTVNNNDSKDQISGSNNTNPDDTSSIENAVLEWARALISQDGNAISSMASDSVLQDLKARNLLTGSEGEYSFQESDTWPQDTDLDVTITGIVSDQASLHYYAWSPDQIVTVWLENLTFGLQDGSYKVISEELIPFENISSFQSYRQAYGYDDIINGTQMDYLNNGAGAALNQMASSSSNSAYQDLLQPESAAIRLLHLSDNASEISLKRYWTENNTVALQILFLQDGTSSYLNMVQPYGQDGIWIPKDYKIDVIHRLSSLDWNEVKQRKLSKENPDLFNIVLIDKFPEHHIEIYGYNDEQVNGEGVAIEFDGKMNYFDWYYATPRFILPDCYWNEAGGQLQMALYNHTGTGLAAQDLHVLQQSGNGILQDNVFRAGTCIDLLYDRISCTYNEADHSLTLYDNQSQTELVEVILAENSDYGYMELGSISNFLLGENIIFRVETGYYPSKSFIAQYENMPVLEIEVLMDVTESEIQFDFGEITIAAP